MINDQLVYDYYQNIYSMQNIQNYRKGSDVKGWGDQEQINYDNQLIKILGNQQSPKYSKRINVCKTDYGIQLPILPKQTKGKKISFLVVQDQKFTIDTYSHNSILKKNSNSIQMLSESVGEKNKLQSFQREKQNSLAKLRQIRQKILINNIEEQIYQLKQPNNIVMKQIFRFPHKKKNKMLEQILEKSISRRIQMKIDNNRYQKSIFNNLIKHKDKKAPTGQSIQHRNFNLKDSPSSIFELRCHLKKFPTAKKCLRAKTVTLREQIQNEF